MCNSFSEKILQAYDYLDQSEHSLIELVRKLISFPTVQGHYAPGAPFGAEIQAALEYILNQASRMGFDTHNVDGYAGVIETGCAKDMIGILCHIDTVPIGEGWTMDPYSGEIKAGKLYGRGALDDKGPMAAALFAMYAAMKAKLLTDRHVRMIIGTNEENGAKGLQYYLSKETAPSFGFSPDSSFPVIYGEKGILRIRLFSEWEKAEPVTLNLSSIQAGDSANQIPGLAKLTFPENNQAMHELKDYAEEHGLFYDSGSISAHGASAHAARPWQGENAIHKLLAGVKDLQFGTKEQKAFANSITNLLGRDYWGEGLGIAQKDEDSGPLTCSLNILKIDAIGGEAIADIRYPITACFDRIRENIEERCGAYGISCEVLSHKAPLYISRDSTLVKSLLQAYNEETDSDWEPVTIGGGTYCRYIPNFVAFGPVFPESVNCSHEADEYIEIEALLRAARIYLRAICNLCKGS